MAVAIIDVLEGTADEEVDWRALNGESEGKPSTDTYTINPDI